MKKYTITLLLMFVGKAVFAQEKTSVKKENDTIIKTEVIEVKTSYAPKVSDAFKIKRKPVVEFTENADKKALNYNIISVPVASTFIPKSGALKGIDIGERERLFDNHVAVGFGNNITPFLEAYIHNNSSHGSEYGASINFIYSNDPVKNTPLSSTFYNAGIDLFYKQEQYYFDWTLGIKASRNKYNWYGLPKNIDFEIATIDAIEEEQAYKNYGIYGYLDFNESFIKDVKMNIGYFSDILDSDELSANLISSFSFPLGRFGTNLEDIRLNASLDFLGGKFANDYSKTNEKKYGLFSIGANPYYYFYVANFDIKFGGKVFFSLDGVKGKGRVFLYPDVTASYPIISKFANLYVGATGGLHNNSFKSLTDNNPYISPTIDITQTNEIFNFFGGLKGILSDNINYNFKASYKNEHDKALFMLNPSKSNGVTTAEINGFSFSGYEYGNSFNVAYDDVKTASVFGEIKYDTDKNIAIGVNGQFNMYDLKAQKEAWNLPELKAELFGKFKKNNWYGGANLYFVGDRKGVIYDGVNVNTVNLNSYIDLNLSGGYYFNDLFSIFLKANNITNSNYQRFTNFNAQGFQVIGGIIWKFDSWF